MENELKIAKLACKQAGEEIKRFYKGKYSIKDKSYHNPVTDADHAANQTIREIIYNEFPNDGWLSEETVDSRDRLEKSRVWIIDPLDGTKEFIEGVPNFTISIGLVENGSPVMGVLFNPVTEELFTAYSGNGAFYNNVQVKCSNMTDLQTAVIVISRSETKRGLWKGTESWFQEQAHIGSVAYKLGLTAARKYNVFATLRPKNEWDVCAGEIILREAGGVLINLSDGTTREYNQRNTLIQPGLIGGNPALVEQFYTRWNDYQNFQDNN
ncbi:MAG: 3'(2'),5'-bisphosphate nucleotidase CysQ [Fidelibacterota bacterium]